MWWFSLNIRVSMVIPRRISSPDGDTLSYIERRNRNFLRECPRWSMMDTAEVLKAFGRHRGNAIVVPGRGGRHWVEISDKPNRDVPLGDPAMGGHASFAMGRALAQPDEKIVLFDSDGDVQMSLGILATIAEQQPKNFYHFM